MISVPTVRISSDISLKIALTMIVMRFCSPQPNDPKGRSPKPQPHMYLKRISRAEIKGNDQVCSPLCSKDQRIGGIYCQASINQRDDFGFDQVRGLNVS